MARLIEQTIPPTIGFALLILLFLLLHGLNNVSSGEKRHTGEIFVKKECIKFAAAN